jgi:hypothetical protein
MHVALDVTHRLPLSHVAFAQQGPYELPQVLQLPAWQIIAAFPASGGSHCPPSAMHTPLPPVAYLQHPPAGHGFGCGMPKVGQHGCPGAPHASHVLAAQKVFAVVHADPGPTHLFVAGSQHPVEAQAGPDVQQGKLS